MQSPHMSVYKQQKSSITASSAQMTAAEDCSPPDTCQDKLILPSGAVHNKQAEFSYYPLGALHQSEHRPPDPSSSLCVFCFVILASPWSGFHDQIKGGMSSDAFSQSKIFRQES